MESPITEEDIKEAARNNYPAVLRELYRRYSSLDERPEDSISSRPTYERQMGQPCDEEVVKECGEEEREEQAEAKDGESEESAKVPEPYVAEKTEREEPTEDLEGIVHPCPICYRFEQLSKEDNTDL